MTTPQPQSPASSPGPTTRRRTRLLLAIIPLMLLAIALPFYLRNRAINHVLQNYEQRGGLVQRGAITPLSHAFVWVRSTLADIVGGDRTAAQESGNDAHTLRGAPLKTDELWILPAISPLRIELPGTPLSPELIDAIPKLANSFQLTLPDSNATDQSLAQLCDALATRSDHYIIELGHTTITNAGLKVIKRLPNLVVLGLESPHIDGGAFTHLNSSTLQQLKLPGCNISDQDILSLTTEFKSINLSDLSRTKVTSQGIAQLVKNKSLGELILDDLPVTDDLLATLTTGPISKFSLARTKITDAGLASFAKCSRIYSLDLSGTRITNAGLVKLPLRGPGILYFEVKLADTLLDDNALPHLLKMSPFIELDLSGTKITDKTLQALTAQPRPPTKILDIKRTPTTLPAIQALKKAHPRLRLITDHGTF